MRILVLGSGVVGVTSAFYLAKAGHEVTVVDRQAASGMETSFAMLGRFRLGILHRGRPPEFRSRRCVG